MDIPCIKESVQNLKESVGMVWITDGLYFITLGFQNKFNAPINVEVCASIKSVKYLYKYVYKGHDATSVRFENENTLDHDKILSFLDGRYVGAPEDMWRLNEFNLSEKSHTVLRLAVRLPDQQAIAYQDGQEEEAVARAATRQTKLTAWFELNKNDQDSHIYLYTDISSLLYF
ncbi:hypothetical protein AVEN_267695-1 [Araneus ventricosus]|uniref:Uncharacterized protein n=1 Tax=Araneus ventricosus TaxID=182803 RepID=A0A4Y2X843_ARAVE|nr:hypothetical protein AVEN_267695-1 [Araneus ventricosus]